MTQNKFTPVVAHAAGWLFFFSLVIGFVSSSPGIKDPVTIVFSWPFLVFGTAYLFLFYFNTYVLIPKLHLQRRFLLYALVMVVLFALFYIVKPFDGMMSQFARHDHEELRPPPGFDPRMGPGGQGMDHPPPPGDAPGGNHQENQTDIVSIILFITVWSLSTAICVNRQWRVTEKRAIQAEADKANAELSFLKAQVNPHFLFNTLNNIYSLAVTGNEQTAESIMKLSNIMRYVTDEVTEDFVPLSNEIQCMGDYIDLQRLRLGKKMNVDFSVTGDTEHKKIAPLMLMTFIENVFKYGISNHASSDIVIKISTDQNNIHFFCQNKLFETGRTMERTGIGIENTRQRLQHLYPFKHLLSITKENGLFTVQLTVQS